MLFKPKTRSIDFPQRISQKYNFGKIDFKFYGIFADGTFAFDF